MYRLKVRFNGWFKVTGQGDPFDPVPVLLRDGSFERVSLKGWIDAHQAKQKGYRPVKILAYGYSKTGMDWHWLQEKEEFIQGALGYSETGAPLLYGVLLEGKPKVLRRGISGG